MEAHEDRPQDPAPEAKGRPARGSGRRPKKRGTLMKSPGFIVSAIIHVAVLLGASAMYLESAFFDNDSFMTGVIRAEQEKFETIEPPKEEKEQPKEEPATLEESDVNLMPGAVEDAARGAGEADARGQDGEGDRRLGVFDPNATGGGYVTQRAIKSGGREKARRAVDKGLQAALRWLARHQSAQGAWLVTQHVRACGARGYAETCEGAEPQGNEQYDVGVTGLALLALLGGGYLPSSAEPVYPSSANAKELGALLGAAGRLTYGEVVTRACLYLVGSQQPNGRLGPDVDRSIYNHAIGTLALCEAYGMTGSWLLRGAAEDALEFLVEARGPEGTWRYTMRARDADASVMGWIVLVLKSAETAGLGVDRSLAEGVCRWYDRATVEATVTAKAMQDVRWNESRTFVLTGYLGPKDAGNLVSIAGLNDHYAFNPCATARMITAAFLLGKSCLPRADIACDTLLAFAPAPWNPADAAGCRHVDFYYWYHATYALHLAADSEDFRWRRWSETLGPVLAETQNLKGFEGRCREGSWEPVDRWSCEGGRVYMTAVGALMLETLRRFPKVPCMDKRDVRSKLID